MNASSNAYQKAPKPVVDFVWYEGTDALKKGEAVCFNTDYGTATAVDGRRAQRVERPSTSNNNAFAGVAARDYSAQTGGQLIEIYIPGSRGVEVALGADVVIGVGMLTFTVGSSTEAGRFVKAGFPGRGSIVPRQTVSAVLEASMAGGWSLATDGVTLTVSDTTGISAGDTVVLLGGEDEGDSKAIVPGKYTVSSITSGTVLVLSSSAVGDEPAAALTCTGYAYTGNPTCQADLLEGPESGGVQFISLPNAGGDNQAYITGGITYVCGGLTLAADAECELADGASYGERKGFVLLGALTTSDFVVDLVTAGLQLDGSALAEVNAIDAAADAVFLEWQGIWRTIGLIGGATQA
ncbi:hypothetical protein [Cerasicoccus frondis]|uniref:hypothetical protein n=1 Tax=Cerasicoccus frondis TaxID=490090 RepID=UPI0028528E68|nr:hypothetical protein [Cerasicoccus frondis]